MENNGKYMKKQKFIREIVDLAVFAACVYFFFNYIFRINFVPTGSMSPTIEAGDIVISSSIPYWFTSPKRGDMVIFFSEELDERLVKRVIGLPGENVDIKENHVFIDGKLLEEPYIGEAVVTKGYGFVDNLVIPQNAYFVLGDNREHSSDSRFFREKYIEEAEIEQKVLFVIRTSRLKEWFGK